MWGKHPCFRSPKRLAPLLCYCHIVSDCDIRRRGVALW